MKLISSWRLLASEQHVELEGNPIRPTRAGSYIEKSGTLWCVRSSNPQDKNFGCYASREEAEAHLNTLHAGGPGSGCNPEAGKCGRKGDAQAPKIEYEHDDTKLTPFMRLTLNDHSFPYLFDNDQHLDWGWNQNRTVLTIEQHSEQVGGLNHKDIWEVPASSIEEWQHATQQRPDYKMAMKGSALKQFKAASQYGRTGWDYGQRTIGRETGYISRRELAGFPTARRGGGGGGRAGVVRPSRPLGRSAPTRRGIGRGTGFGTKTHIHPPKVLKTPNFGHVPKIHVPKMKVSPLGKAPSSSPLGRMPQLQSFADMGEPMTGAMGHAHIDPVTWFRPPSLTKREKPGEDNHVPADNPREKNDKYLDVTKRNSKDTIEQKYKMLRRSAPGGLPPSIPARTTALEPHMGFYMPLSQVFSSAKKSRKMLRGSNYTSYSRRGCI